MKKNKGITLVALVVTIVILLILAGVSINLVVGDNGIITQARKAREETNKANENEMSQLDKLANSLEAVDYEGGSWSNAKNICTPRLGKNMVAVYWTDKNKTLNDNGKYKAVAGNETAVMESNVSTAVEVTSEDSKFDWAEWYDYVAGDNTNDTKTSRWANAKSIVDGSYFVWIPRYEYKILSNEHKTETGKITVNFIDTSKQSPTEGYKIHPAFTNNTKLGGWDSNISGVWVAKYEMSMEQTADNGATWTNTEVGNSIGDKTTTVSIRATSKPNVYSWAFITINNCFTNSLNYSTNSNTGANSHLMKNSEWGACSYLTHSQYGRNGKEITINNYYKDSTNYAKLTGFSTGSTNTGATTDASNTANLYNGSNGMLSSTTGNLYGIYDISGGNFEYVSGIYSRYGNANLSALYSDIKYTLNGNTLSKLPDNNDSTKYVTVYPTSDIGTTDANISLHYNKGDWANMYGDAIWETSEGELPRNNGSWNNDRADYEADTASTEPAFIRGGCYWNGTGAGSFAFDDGAGWAHYYIRLPRRFSLRVGAT